MKCLSVRQPWAWAIISGVKAIENRSWPTRHRGPLAIHAGRSRAEFGGACDFAAMMLGVPGPDELAFGAVIGAVDVVDCLPYEMVKDYPFAEPGGFCWILENPMPVTPIPMVGRLGLFEVEQVQNVPIDAFQRALPTL